MRRASKSFAICVDNRGNEASLILGKVYRFPEAARKRILASIPTTAAPG